MTNSGYGRLAMKFALSSVLLVCACILIPSARADTISFTGDLRTDATFLPPGLPPFTDGDIAQWAAVVKDFHVSSTSLMTAITFSYGGGTNGANNVIAQGGFQPYLSLFDSGGNFLASTFFGTTCPTGAHTNTNSSQCFDVQLAGGSLAAGDYQIAISAFENLSFAENLGTGTLADGFTGLGNLGTGEDLHYAFDVVLKSSTSTVPEPATGWLFSGAMLAVVWMRRIKS